MASFTAKPITNPSTGKPARWTHILYTELVLGNNIELEDWADQIYGSKSSEAQARVSTKICGIRRRIEEATSKMLIARDGVYFLVDPSDSPSMLEEVNSRFGRSKVNLKTRNRGIEIGLKHDQKNFRKIAIEQAQELVALIVGAQNVQPTTNNTQKSIGITAGPKSTKKRV